jgi:hypothetical protein
MTAALGRLLERLEERLRRRFYAYVGPRPEQVHIFFRERGLMVHVWTLTHRDDYEGLIGDSEFLARFATAVRQGEARLRRKLSR